MTEQEEVIADVIASCVNVATATVRARLTALEARAAVPGPQGLPGPAGTPGADGKDGSAGRDGVLSLASIEAHVGSRIDGLETLWATLGVLDERVNWLETSVQAMEVQRAGTQLDPAEIAATCEGLLRTALAQTRRPAGRRQRGLHV